jgi:hypothetical protein
MLAVEHMVNGYLELIRPFASYIFVACGTCKDFCSVGRLSCLLYHMLFYVY